MPRKKDEGLKKPSKGFLQVLFGQKRPRSNEAILIPQSKGGTRKGRGSKMERRGQNRKKGAERLKRWGGGGGFFSQSRRMSDSLPLPSRDSNTQITSQTVASRGKCLQQVLISHVSTNVACVMTSPNVSGNSLQDDVGSRF